MNTYRVRFFSECPTNGVRIEYLLAIETDAVIAVEDILAAVKGPFDTMFHEAIADVLSARFGGSQTMTAVHHGVEIETQRP